MMQLDVLLPGCRSTMSHGMTLCLLAFSLQTSVASSSNADVARTPPMGWSSWNALHCGISEGIIANVSKGLVDSGLKDAGYVYVNLDDCWMAKERDNVTGELIAGRNFPSGMKALGDALHAQGLKFGLYSDRGFKTCQSFPGLLDNEARDVATMAKFGIDFLKNDGCYTTAPQLEGDGMSWMKNEPNSPAARTAYEVYARTHAAIIASGRAIVHNIKGQPGGGMNASAARSVSNLRRCGDDIGDSWGSAVGEFINCQKDQRFAGAGYWNDPDSLEVGNGKQTKLEYRSHFAMWCVGKHPLILGFPLGRPGYPTCVDCASSHDIYEILLNKELIAVNQDALGAPALATITIPCNTSVADNASAGAMSAGAWGGPLSGGAHVLMVLNQGDYECVVTLALGPALNVSNATRFSSCARIDDASAKVPCAASPPTSGASVLTLRIKSHEAIVLRLEGSSTSAVEIDAVALAPPSTMNATRSARTARTFAPRVTSGAPLAAAWPMLGHDAAHSGRSSFRGPASCNVQWNALNHTRVNRDSASYTSTPVVANGLVLIAINAGSGGVLVALDATSGVQRWNRSMNGSVWATPLIAALTATTSAVILGDESGVVVAFGLRDGKPLWQLRTGGPVFSSAVTADASDAAKVIYLQSWDHRMYSVDRATGEVLATIDLGTMLRSTPALRTVSTAAHGASVEHLYLSVGTALIAVESRVGAFDGTMNASASVIVELWRHDTTNWAIGSPSLAADDKTVFFPPSGSHEAFALDASSGAVKWRAGALENELIATADASAVGALAADGSAYYVLGRDGSNCGSIVVALDTTTGGSLWQRSSGGGWPGALDACGDSAALTVDSSGVVWVVSGKNMLYGFSSAGGNATLNCSSVGRQGNMGGVTIASDGVLIAFTNVGGVTAVGLGS